MPDSGLSAERWHGIGHSPPLDGAALVLTDLGVACRPLELVPLEQTERFSLPSASTAEDNHALLEKTHGRPLPARHPVLARSLARRNLAVFPLSGV